MAYHGMGIDVEIPAITNDEYLDYPLWTIRNQLGEDFIDLVEGRERDIDPAGTLDWHAFAKGYALTMGLSPECSQAFATFAIHYNGFNPNGNK